MNLFDVYPLFDIEPVKASGSYIWDKHGKKYLDFYGGHAVISIGHSHPHYVERLTQQLKAIGFYSNSVQIPQQQELAARLGALSGCDDYNLFLCNSGAEANENALKLASFHTGRKKIIAFGKAFHGRTSLAVAATDDPGIVSPVNQTEHISFLPLNDEAALEQAMNSEVCAVIVEGIQGVGGIQVPSAAFLQKAEALCRQHGALFILDEIQSGYGRSGKFFMHQHAGISPDLITTAKGMGNGFPVAGVLIAPHIKAKHGMLGTTFGGNHLACAAALAVVEVIEQENLVANAERMGQYLTERIATMPGIKAIRGKGLMIGIDTEADSALVRKELLNKYGVFTGYSSSTKTIRLLPALNITQQEADEFLEALRPILQSHLTLA